MQFFAHRQKKKMLLAGFGKRPGQLFAPKSLCDLPAPQIRDQLRDFFVSADC
jgi:hypothetical protein